MRLSTPDPRKYARDFIADEDGFVTIFALMVMMIVLVFSGMSLDSANAWRMKDRMQTATDAAAHAAAMDLPDTDAALVTALAYANTNLPPDAQDNAVTSEDVSFGTWDADTRVFTETASSPDSVRVRAKRTDANSNGVPTFLLWYVGLKSWNIETESVVFAKQVIAGDKCLGNAIVTDGEFSMTSNNDFYNNYCVHAAGGISMNNNNQYDDDVLLSVENFSDIDWPSSVSMSTVVGRGTAASSATLTYGDIFEENEISSPYISDVSALAADFLDPLYAGQPDYINGAAAVIELDANDVKYTSFIPGRIYDVGCGGSKGNKAEIFKSTELEEVVIVSECKIQIGTKAELTDVILVSLDTGNKSVKAASKVVLGADDSCADGGGVSIYTAGDFTSSSSLELYGAYISAVGKVTLTSKADSIGGLTVHAGGDVSVTAQAQFGTCVGTVSNDGLLTTSLRIVN